MDLGLLFGDIVLDMPVGYEEILPPSVVYIEEERAEGKIVQARRSHATGDRILPIERRTHLIVERGLLPRKVSDDHAALAVIVHVIDVDAHARVRLSLLVGGDSHLHAYLLEAVMAEVMEEEAWHAVVGHVDVGPSVVVVVPDGYAERLARHRNACALADVGEGSIVIVMIEHAVRGLERGRNGIGALAHLIIRNIVLERVIGDVVADKEVEVTIIVYVDPGAARAPHPVVGDPGPLRDVGKAAMAIIVKEMARSQGAGDVDIVIAVVIVVPDGHAHGVHHAFI